MRSVVVAAESKNLEGEVVQDGPIEIPPLGGSRRPARDDRRGNGLRGLGPNGSRGHSPQLRPSPPAARSGPLTSGLFSIVGEEGRTRLPAGERRVCFSDLVRGRKTCPCPPGTSTSACELRSK